MQTLRDDKARNVEVDYWVGSTVRIEGSDVLVWSRRGDYYIIPVMNILAEVAAVIASLAVVIAHVRRRRVTTRSSASPTRSLESVPSGEAERV